MFFRNLTKPTASASSVPINRLKEEIRAADAIVIGAGAGLSTSAGFTYADDRFQKSFSDFEAKYGFHDMYSGGFYPYPTQEEHWAYWSRYIAINRYQDAPNLFTRTSCGWCGIRTILCSPKCGSLFSKSRV
jgi:NAD-dependent SIR2 family protein deacetylase